MTNPFEDDNGEFCVLINDQGAHSLWPVVPQIPAGWTVVGPTGVRLKCLDWIEESWKDMRPRSLADAMDRRQNADS